MPQVYNKTTNKSTRRNEKNSEKEILDNENVFKGHTIQRCPHDKKNKYVVVSTQLVNDMSISGDCVRMLIYLLAKPDDWNITVKTLQKQLAPSGVGPKKIYKIITEAIEAGYMKREVQYNGNLSSAVRYFVSEKPRFKKCFRHTPLGHAPNGHVIHSTDVLPSTDIRNNTKKPVKLKPDRPKPTPPPSAIIFHVKIGDTGITESEYQTLHDEIGLENLTETLDSMHKWVTEPGTKRKFASKDIMKKIRQWNERYQRDKKTLKYRNEESEKKKSDENKRKCEETRENNRKILEKFLKNDLYKNKIKITKTDVVVDSNGLKYHNLFESGLEKFLEKVLLVKME